MIWIYTVCKKVGVVVNRRVRVKKSHSKLLQIVFSNIFFLFSIFFLFFSFNLFFENKVLVFCVNCLPVPHEMSSII